MAARDPNLRSQIAQQSARARWGDDDARRELKADALERRIRELVDAAPPLTDEQRGKLADLLRPSAAA